MKLIKPEEIKNDDLLSELIYISCFFNEEIKYICFKVKIFVSY